MTSPLPGPALLNAVLLSTQHSRPLPALDMNLIAVAPVPCTSIEHLVDAKVLPAGLAQVASHNTVLPRLPATARSCPDCLASTCCVAPADLDKYLASGKLSTAATQRVPAPPSSYGISDMPQPVTVPGAAMPQPQQSGGSLSAVGCWSPQCCSAPNSIDFQDLELCAQGQLCPVHIFPLIIQRTW